MRTEEVIRFFDRLAPTWDRELIRNDKVIDYILDVGGVCEGKQVLDVACGTGVLFPDYERRAVAGVTAVDISPGMARIAAAKCRSGKCGVICGDILELRFDRKFDCVMIYNAFPHFADPDRLLMHLAGCLAEGGRLTVAHGMSREKINAHHQGSAKDVSLGLPRETELAALMSAWFEVDATVSDAEKYIVSGTLKERAVTR